MPPATAPEQLTLDDGEPARAPRVELRRGDMLDVLPTLPAESVHAVVTDPPYGLADHKPAVVAAAVTAWLGGDRDHVPDGRGFMGKEWDGFVPPPAVWDECLRVLKPGGYLLCFSAPRTVDLMGLSIRLAGFEIRDTITWHYGQGFPKSSNVSRDQRFCQCSTGPAVPYSHVAEGSSADVPGLPGRVLSVADERGPQAGRGRSVCGGCGKPRVAAGLGTALKPASEPIVVARKPLVGTVAATVLAHGTGALNVDATRVATTEDLNGGAYTGTSRHDDTESWRFRPGQAGEYVQPSGRWPANVVLTHAPDCAEQCEPGCPVAELDAQSGALKSGGPVTRGSTRQVYGAAWQDDYVSADRNPGDSGGASRFFPTFRYQAKAPSKERPKIDGKVWPTVKPLALMRWLVRLVTPPAGGTVLLDCFAGTGTTLQAARDEGLDSIGVERDPFAYALACQRLGLEVAA